MTKPHDLADHVFGPIKTVGATAYGVSGADHRVEFEETEQGVLLVVKGDTTNGTTATIGITLDADDLTRALFAASPSFVASIGNVAGRAIFAALGNVEKS